MNRMERERKKRRARNIFVLEKKKDNSAREILVVP